jgi:hypothetical protein
VVLDRGPRRQPDSERSLLQRYPESTCYRRSPPNSFQMSMTAAVCPAKVGKDSFVMKVGAVVVVSAGAALPTFEVVGSARSTVVDQSHTGSPLSAMQRSLASSRCRSQKARLLASGRLDRINAVTGPASLRAPACAIGMWPRQRRSKRYTATSATPERRAALSRRTGRHSRCC